MKRKIKVVICLMLLFCTGFTVKSQIYNIKKRYEQVSELKESTLLVVLSSNEKDTLNSVIKKAMEKYWTFSNVDYIKSAEVASYEKKGGYFILYILPESVDGKKITNWLYILKRLSNDGLDKNWYDARFALPLKYEKKSELQIYNYTYLMPFIIRYMQNEIDFVYQSGGSSKAETDRVARMTKMENKIKTMKIYFNSDETDCPENVKKVLAKLDKIPVECYQGINTKGFIKVLKSAEDNAVVYINGYYYSAKEAILIKSTGIGYNYLDCSVISKQKQFQ